MNINVARFGVGGFTPVPYGPPALGTPPRVASRPTYAPARFRPSRMGQIGTARAVAAGTLLVGTGISAAIGYFGIQAGLKEKGFLAVLGWLFGIPAALSTVVGVVSLAGLALEATRDA